MTNFLLGVIIGILVRDIKMGTDKVVKQALSEIAAIVEDIKQKDETKFIEPVEVRKEFERSNKIDEFLNKLK